MVDTLAQVIRRFLHSAMYKTRNRKSRNAKILREICRQRRNPLRSAISLFGTVFCFCVFNSSLAEREHAQNHTNARKRGLPPLRSEESAPPINLVFARRFRFWCSGLFGAGGGTGARREVEVFGEFFVDHGAAAFAEFPRTKFALAQESALPPTARPVAADRRPTARRLPQAPLGEKNRPHV